MSVGGPDLCSCSALRQAARHVTRFYDTALMPVGLGLNQYAVLAKLDRHGPQVLQDLAGRLVMDRSSLGHLLRPLQARGLVEITVSDADRRNRIIATTRQGAALLAQAKPCWAEAERRFEASFGADEALQLRSILKRITTVEFGA